ncbi:MAG: c-type cytochrome [Rhodanobacteraceae bacterium]
MRLVAFLILALIVTTADAAPPKPARLGLCAACHGEDGRARIPGAPNLAAQNYDYLLNALHDYKSGARDVAVMRAATGSLSELEMRQLARWYACLPCLPNRREP